MTQQQQNDAAAAASTVPGRLCGSMTLQEFFDSVYTPHMRTHKRSWKVDESITRRHIAPTFGKRPLKSIERHEVEAWMDRLARDLSPSTCNRVLAVFKTICSVAVRQNLLRGCPPCAGVRPLKVTSRRERFLSLDEARRLMRHLERSDRQEAFALRLLLRTGARKNEILKASWKHVRLDQRLLVVPLSKSGRPRHIQLSDEAIAVLRALPRRDDGTWLFPYREENRPISDIYPFWNRVRQELGLQDVRVHDLRHSFASFLVNDGHSLYEVQKLLGHADPKTTMRYAHMGQNELRAAAQAVSHSLAQTSALVRRVHRKTRTRQRPMTHARRRLRAAARGRRSGTGRD